MNWDSILASYKATESYRNLWKKVETAYENSVCFPPKDQIFRAFQLTPFDEVKVVILGQDPYHDYLQANGLSFSVSEKVKTPPSLRNIFKELENDVGIKKTSNELENWAKQGILLLNTILTVEAHRAHSHKDFGWQDFTDFIIKEISKNKENVIFVLWGKPAQKKEKLIDAERHFIMKSAHPSPLSAYRGFFGSQPFSKINQILKSLGKEEIYW